MLTNAHSPTPGDGARRCKNSRDFSRAIRLSFQGPREEVSSVSGSRYLVPGPFVVKGFEDFFSRPAREFRRTALGVSRRGRRGGGYMSLLKPFGKIFLRRSRPGRNSSGFLWVFVRNFFRRAHVANALPDARREIEPESHSPGVQLCSPLPLRRSGFSAAKRN